LYFLPNISSVFKTLKLKDTIDSILDKNLDFLKELYKSLEESIVPFKSAEKILMTSLEQYTTKGISPEMLDYLSRMNLRSLVGLPPVPISTKNKDAIRELEGSISWLTEEEIDVTEFIRKMREVG